MKHAQNLLFTVALLFTLLGCKKEEEKVAKVSNANYYYSGDFGGTKVLIEDGNGYLNDSGSIDTTGAGKGPYDENQVMIFVNKSIDIVVNITFRKRFPKVPEFCSQIEGMLKVGKYPFSKIVPATGTGDDTYTEGVDITFRDDKGVYWSTFYNSNVNGDQNGSNFEIIENTPNKSGPWRYNAKIKLNCKFYDNNGNMKLFTNGEVRSRSVLCKFQK